MKYYSENMNLIKIFCFKIWELSIIITIIIVSEISYFKTNSGNQDKYY